MEAPASDRLTGRDYALLVGICLLFFGLHRLVANTLNVHETIHCQNTREMLADGDWVIPHYGNRPWLERPPLPFWITAPFVAVLGDVDWAFLLPPMLLGTGIVLMTASMAAGWFGRRIGFVSGAALGTSLDFITYASGAESDIFLCFLITTALVLFARIEYGPNPPDERGGFFGSRPIAVLALFVALGLTNLTKGLGFGTAWTLSPIAVVLLIGRRQSIRRYVWFWGLLAFAAVALPWPILVYLRYPDALEFWHNDYVWRALTEPPRPVWYYFEMLPWMLLPWTIHAVAGFWMTHPWAEQAETSRGKWFLLAWAIVPVCALSLSNHKHHHYLLAALAPWSVYAGVGLTRSWDWWLERAPGWLRRPATGAAMFTGIAAIVCIPFRSRLPGPAWAPAAIIAAVGFAAALLWSALGSRRAPVALGAALALLCAGRVGIDWGERVYLAHYKNDYEFLSRALAAVPADAPILVDGEDGPLTASWWMHYGHGRLRLLHNLSFLRDDRLDPNEVYVIGRRFLAPEMAKYGDAEIILESKRSRQEYTPEWRYTLFRLQFRADLERRTANVRFSPMQATCRAPGPFLD